MIAGLHSQTGLPIIEESRPLGLHVALPRSLHETVKTLTDWTVRYAAPMPNGDLMIRCWKCGRDLPGGFPVPGQSVNGQGVVAMGMMNHYRETRIATYLPRIGREAIYTVLHCADCIIAEEHGPQTVAIHVAGHDEQQFLKPILSRHEWATSVWQWGDAETRRKVCGPLKAHEGI